MKLLFFGESPLNPTGFGQVNRHLASAFAREVDVTYIASGHYYAGYDRSLYPYDIIGCPNVPPHERTIEHQRNLWTIEKYIKEANWDVFATQVDLGWWNDTVLTWAKEVQEAHPEKDTIFYFPIDGDISLAHAFTPLSWCSVPVVYTEHARSVIAKYAPLTAEKTSVMWLGTEPEVFYPMSPEERRAMRLKFFGEKYLDRFICLNTNRNQMRKDLMRSMAAFHQFHQKYPDSTLHLHTVPNDIGGSIEMQARLVGCDMVTEPKEITCSGLDLARPWSRQTLNELYNACDVLISTAYGEGWGLCTTEAMAAGIPVVVPYNTANIDILGRQMLELDPMAKFREEHDLPAQWHDFHYERGWGVKTGGDLDHTIFTYQNGGSVASIIHAESFVETLEYIYQHKEEAQAKAQVARAWCEQNSWQKREEAWQKLLLMIKDRQSGQN